LGALTVVTGPIGSGKSSLAFDSIYAEGQRRCVETFSPYARQFLDRMDKPAVDAIEGIPPAIAIDQTNPVKNSRSAVGTMTELKDHLKLLFARAARLFCQGCGREVRRDSSDDVVADVLERGDGRRAVIAFEIALTGEVAADKVRAELDRQGYTRVEALDESTLRVTQDRVRLSADRRERITEAVEAALRAGQGAPGCCWAACSAGALASVADFSSNAKYYNGRSSILRVEEANETGPCTCGRYAPYRDCCSDRGSNRRVSPRSSSDRSSRTNGNIGRDRMCVGLYHP